MRILIVEDEPRVGQFVERGLAQVAYTPTWVRSCQQAEGQLADNSSDAIILDLNLPDGNGLDLLRRWRAAGRQEPILILSARDAVQDRITGLNLGADDYLAKPFEPRELLLRIGAVLRRTPVASAKSSTVRLGRWSFDPARAELVGPDGPQRLTDVEASLLAVLAASPGQSFSRDELSARSTVSVAPRSVDVQVVRLRRKIEEDPRLPRYLQTVRGEGYVLRPD